MNFRGKCEPPAFSPVGIDDPNTGSAGFRAPDGCGHAPPVTRDSDVTPVERRLSSRTQIIAGPVVPFHLGTWITGLIYQDAIPGNREARREGRAVVTTFCAIGNGSPASRRRSASNGWARRLA